MIHQPNFEAGVGDDELHSLVLASASCVLELLDREIVNIRHDKDALEAISPSIARRVARISLSVLEVFGCCRQRTRIFPVRPHLYHDVAKFFLKPLEILRLGDLTVGYHEIPLLSWVHVTVWTPGPHALPLCRH